MCKDRVQLAHDNSRAYKESVSDAFDSQMDFALLHQIYGKTGSTANSENNFGPAECIR